MAISSPLARFSTLLLISFAFVVALPLIALSFYNHPSPADDYCFANTAMRYGFWQSQQIYYDGWSGRFFHNFLVHSSPLTIGWHGGYKLYPIVLLGLVGAGFIVFTNQWLHRSVGAGTKLAVAAGLFVLYMGTLASLSEFMYWYPGMACYALSMPLLLFLLATMMAHQRRGFGPMPGFLFLESLLITCIVGSSETGTVIVMSILGLLVLGEFVQRRRLSVTTVVLFGVGLVGFYFLITAPGNAIRMGSNPASSNISLTLLSSLKYAIGYVGNQLILTPLLPLTMLYLPVAHRLTTVRSLPNYLRLHPLLALLHGSMTVLALIALHFYGVGIPPVTRLINVVNLTFYLSWGYTLTLLVVALRPRLDRWKPYARPITGIALATTALAIGFGPVVPLAYGDWFSGRAAQYDRAMQQRYAQMAQTGDTSVMTVPLPAYPASMYLEDIKNDPKHLWNQCWADYYHKKTIVLKDEPNRSAQ